MLNESKETMSPKSTCDCAALEEKVQYLYEQNNNLKLLMERLMQHMQTLSQVSRCLKGKRSF